MSALAPALLLDTHVLLWLDNGDDKLRPATVRLIDECRQQGGTIFVSAVSAWEVALLVESGKLDLDLPVAAWFERFLNRPGVAALPLSVAAASYAYRLFPYEHRDPADRMLMASAIEAGCPLVSYDERILQFGRRHGSQHRLSVVS